MEMLKIVRAVNSLSSARRPARVCCSKWVLSPATMKTPTETPVEAHLDEGRVSETNKTRMSKGQMNNARVGKTRMEKVLVEKGPVDTTVKAAAKSGRSGGWPPPAPWGAPTPVPKVASIRLPAEVVIRIGISVRIGDLCRWRQLIGLIGMSRRVPT